MLKQRVRDIVQPTKDLGHSDVKKMPAPAEVPGGVGAVTL